MGLLVATMRRAQLRDYRSDLEYKIMLVSATRLDLANQIDNIVGLSSDLAPDSPEAKALEKKKERLHQVERALDQKLQRYQQQLQMVEAEEQQVQGQLQNAIQRAYA